MFASVQVAGNVVTPEETYHTAPAPAYQIEVLKPDSAVGKEDCESIEKGAYLTKGGWCVDAEGRPLIWHGCGWTHDPRDVHGNEPSGACSNYTADYTTGGSGECHQHGPLQSIDMFCEDDGTGASGSCTMSGFVTCGVGVAPNKHSFNFSCDGNGLAVRVKSDLGASGEPYIRCEDENGNVLAECSCGFGANYSCH